MTVRSKLILRVVVVLVMALALGGPTPGRLGGCGADAAGAVDPHQFCLDYRTTICARNYALNGDAGEHDRCRGGVSGACAGFNFEAGCFPSQASTQACLGALVDLARLSTPPDLLPECTFCSGSGGGMEPEGI